MSFIRLSGLSSFGNESSMGVKRTNYFIVFPKEGSLKMFTKTRPRPNFSNTFRLADFPVVFFKLCHGTQFQQSTVSTSTAKLSRAINYT